MPEPYANVGQEIVPSIWTDIDRSLMAREKVFFEAPTHCMPLDAGGVQEEVVRSQARAENLSTRLLAYESTDSVVLEKGLENHRLHQARKGELESFQNNEPREQERERAKRVLPCGPRQELEALASKEVLYLDSGMVLET